MTCLRPDLWTCCQDMCLAVSHIVELVRPHRIIEFLGVASSLVVVVLGIGERHSRHGVYLSTKHTQQVDFLG